MIEKQYSFILTDARPLLSCLKSNDSTTMPEESVFWLF